MRAPGTPSLSQSIGRPLACVAAVAMLTIGLSIPAALAGPLGKFSVPTVAVVDESAVMNASIAVKNIKSQIDKYRDAYQKELSTRDAALRKLEIDLQSQGSTLAPDVLAQKQKEIADKAQSERALLQDRQQKLTAAFERAMLQVQAEAKRVVDEIALQDHISLVLPTATVVDAVPEMNLTSEVTARLNARLTAVPVHVAN
jgi:Skp family chaperone for outer membrane proteins